jgi:hydroxymethylbilane synthase
VLIVRPVIGNSMSAAHPSAATPAVHTRDRPLLVGTRGSPLALWQARDVIARLRRVCDQAVEEHVIRTTGDVVLDRPLAEIGGKGLFAKETHEALLAGRVDFAVHSLKDLETQLPPGVVLACTLPREDARDALILGPICGPPDPAAPFAALPPNAVVGSASVRRQAQLKHARPDLEVRSIRGNVQTRLSKLADGQMAATLLALAGLRRLGLEDRASIVLDPAVMLPAAGQGIVGVTVRAGDTELCGLLAAIEDPEARAVSTAERSLLATLDGSCRTPIGAYATLRGAQLSLTGLVARADGSFLLRRSLQGTPAAADALGRELGASLRAGSPTDLFAA